jgi:hypothetical protein
LLGAVEEQVAELLGRAPTELAEDLSELEKRVSELRGVVDADQSGHL